MPRIRLFVVLAGLSVLTLCVPVPPATAAGNATSIEERMQRLEARQQQLEQELDQKDRRIEELEKKLDAAETGVTPQAVERPGADSPPAAEAPATVEAAPPSGGNLPSGAEASATPSGEVAVGTANGKPVEKIPDEYQTWGAMDPGKGFEVARTEYGNLIISGYALARYINQLPADQNFVDHLGRRSRVDTREDISLHRVLLHAKGWAYSPRFRYAISTWTVNSLETVRLIGFLSYDFAKWLTLTAGVGGLPGTRSLQGSHPLWLAHDRVMADEYFRPGFTQGVWAEGEMLHRLRYKLMVANNLSALGVSASELTRDFAYAGSLTWMPTTGEFGPQGGFGDFENHLQLATRFGAAYTISPDEDRNSQPGASSPDNTQIRIGDSQLLFAKGTLGEDITVQKARYQLAAGDIGFKYRGFFAQAEGYFRRLDQLQSEQDLPVKSFNDYGFYVQTSAMVWPELVEAYASTSFVFTDDSSEMDGENTSYEWLVGVNWFPFHTRYQRINLQFVDVTRSPTSSDFGFYKGGLNGYVLAVAASVAF
jgi:hypothetical protein